MSSMLMTKEPKELTTLQKICSLVSIIKTKRRRVNSSGFVVSFLFFLFSNYSRMVCVFFFFLHFSLSLYLVTTIIINLMVSSVHSLDISRFDGS